MPLDLTASELKSCVMMRWLCHTAAPHPQCCIDALGPRALEWLEKGLRLRSVDLEGLKVDPLFDPLRKEPRFQAIERELKFPQ